jgi:hypothetical protein
MALRTRKITRLYVGDGVKAQGAVVDILINATAKLKAA